MSVVSSVLSRVSTRSRPPVTNVNLSSFMDNAFSIVFGLGLRFVVDTVSHQDFKLTGTLVGLWEGVILLHFTKKTPKSSDPYIAFAVRLCVDFWLTESVARLVLVLIWTGLGMILADITPAIWSDVGLNRVWRRLRRDLYTIFHMVPTVAFFPPQRTVRFSPSHAPSVIGEEDVDDAASDITATAHTPSAPVVPPRDPILPPSRDARKRRVPGHYGFEYSDTETERSFGFTPPRAGRTSRRQSLYPGQAPYDESLSASSITPTEDVDVDAGNLSDGVSSSAGTERVGPSSTSLINMSEVQGTEEGAAAAAVVTAVTAVAPPTIDTAGAAAAAAAATAKEGPSDDAPGPRTPTQQPLWIPPTPSDSAAAWRLSRAREAAYLDTAPPSAITPVLPVPVRAPMPQIPDFLDEPLTEDWTDLGRSVVADPFTAAVTATTAPAPAATTTTDAPAIPTAENPTAPPGEHTNNSLLDPPAYDAWPSASAPAAAGETREYKTAADFDDIYGDEAPAVQAAAGEEGQAVAANDPFAGETGDLLGGDSTGAGAETTGVELDSVWDDTAAREAAQANAAAAIAEEARKVAEEQAAAEAETQRLAEEAETQRLAAEEAEAQRLAEEAAAADALAKRLADEAEAAKKEKKEMRIKAKKDADERRAKEEADEAARQQKRAEEEAAAKAKEEEEKMQKKKKDAEAAAERRAQKAREKEEKAAKAEAERKAKEEQEQEERERIAKEQEEADRVEKEKEKEEADRKAKEERERLEREEAERQEHEKQEQEERERQAAEQQEGQQAEMDTAADAALDAALAQEQADADAWQAQTTEQAQVPWSGQEEAAAEENLHVSTGFSPEPLVNLNDDAMASEPAAQAPAYEESVVSDASALAPSDPRERVERMMVLRAQMVEIEKQIDDLKAGGAGEDSAALRQMEKVMRKMVRQATRRYAAGIECAQFLNGFDDTPDLVSLENLHPNAVIKKVAELIESLLSPSARSLHFSVQIAKKVAEAKKQKPKVVELIDEFNLTNYTTENAKNKKISEIDIPEEAFGTWLTEYRNLLAKRAQQEEEPEYSPWG